MNKEIFKVHFRLILNQLFPAMYFKWLTTRYLVTNNMNIYILKEYHSRGTFTTMWDFPPKYYNKWKKKQGLDKTTIPAFAPDGSKRLSAVPIVQYGICEYGYYIHTNEKEHFETAEKVANWLIDNQDSNGGWLYNYDYYHPRMEEIIKGPWVCGMAQGEAAGFLARMFDLTHKAEYLKAAEKALQPLTVPVEQGGVLRQWGEYMFFEEYPTSKPSLTLNGFMYCLVGLHDYYDICGSKNAKNLFDKGMSTLLKLLPLYDSENTTYYDLSHITNPPRKPQHGTKYDPLHVMLLQTLNLFYPNDVLKFYIEKWSHGIITKNDLERNNKID